MRKRNGRSKSALNMLQLPIRETFVEFLNKEIKNF